LTSVHLGFHFPGKPLNLGIADLEAIDDFDPGLIFDVEKQDLILLFHLPAAGNAGGDDVDIAVNTEAAMFPWSATAMNIDRRSEVNNDHRVIARRDFDDTGRVGTKSNAGVHDFSVVQDGQVGDLPY
jgi:hypothetical protein